MRGLLLISSFIITVSNTQAQNDNIDYQLKGKVKSLVQSEYEVNPKSKNIENGKLLAKFYSTFNDKENIIETIGYEPNGNIKYRTAFLYDSQGKNIEKKSI